MLMNLDIAKSLLPEARELAGLASEEWSESYDAKNLRAEICIHDRMTGEVTPIAVIGRDCSYDDRRLMIKAPVLLRALLTLLSASFAEIRSLRPPEDPRAADRRAREEKRRAKDFAAECVMKCDDRLFRAFLQDRYNVPSVADGERIAVSIRNILRIQSRAELNTDDGARNRWLELRAAFEAWKTPT